MTGQKGRKCIDGIINTSVLREVDLWVCEKDHRPVCTVAYKFARLREANGVVERQTEGLMSVFTTFALEEIGLKVIQEREEGTALRGKDQSGQVVQKRWI